MSSMMTVKTDPKCNVCGFGLFLPIKSLSVSNLGLYDDARFPGRCILTLNQHYDNMLDVPAEAMASFLEDARISIKAIMDSTDCERVNFAILGNRESHVHAHLIPRYPAEEEFPDCSPWNDPREKDGLSKDDRDAIMSKIAVMTSR